VEELIKVMHLQAQALDRVVGALEDYTASNAALLKVLLELDDEEDVPESITDLEGNPIRGLG
jgi:hypothetical protein